MCVVPVGNKSFKASDTYRLALNTADAFAFTLRFLRTDSSANGRERRCAAYDLISALKIPFLYLCYELRDMDIYRASRNAGHVFARKAAQRLIYRHFIGISVCNLKEVMRPDIRLLRRHGVLCKSHVWLLHFTLPPLQKGCRSLHTRDAQSHGTLHLLTLPRQNRPHNR